jgi:hypothetical protein
MCKMWISCAPVSVILIFLCVHSSETKPWDWGHHKELYEDISYRNYGSHGCGEGTTVTLWGQSFSNFAMVQVVHFNNPISLCKALERLIWRVFKPSFNTTWLFMLVHTWCWQYGFLPVVLSLLWRLWRVYVWSIHTWGKFLLNFLWHFLVGFTCCIIVI